MKEMGGYIELDTYTGTMIHSDGEKLNCGRNALAYIIQAKKIEKLLLPKFMCDSCNNILKRNQVQIHHYSIGLDFKPINLDRDKDEWLYIVNYYGQLSNEYLKSLGEKVIIDNAQAYFQEPIIGIDTIYTCRKFFGVADGAILYTDKYLYNLSQDESFERMHFLLGRYERSADEFYSEYVENNKRFNNEPIRRMSKLTENLLNGINYNYVKAIRTKNFQFLDNKFSKINKLVLSHSEGAFMYPLYINNGAEIRLMLQQQKIFIPTLWPAVFNICSENELEFDMAKNILPLPVDQRYNIAEMQYMIDTIRKMLN